MKSIEEIRDMLDRLGKLKLGFYPTPFHRLDLRGVWGGVVCKAGGFLRYDAVWRQ